MTDSGQHVGEVRRVLRDCDATLIPVGTRITIPQGSDVTITQALGGSYTVNVYGNLARIDARDADALGFEPPSETAPEEGAKSVESDQKETGQKQAGQAAEVNEEQVWAALSTCYDPEIPVNIVELGLIYHVDIQPVEGGGSRVHVVMTLTAPGCGMGPILVEDVRAKLLALDGVREADVELVFDPPWDRSMMSEAARLQLGLF